MKFEIGKDLLQEKLSIASRFTMTKISSIPSLQGALLKTSATKLEIITTNLNEFFHTFLPLKNSREGTVIVDIKKIVEFLSFLPPGNITVETVGNTFTIQSAKTKGSFGLMPVGDFPAFPNVDGKKYTLKKHLFEKELPFVFFAAAHDETRPILTGINFSRKNDENYIVSTDGFRLSIVTDTSKETLFEANISGHVLEEVSRIIGDQKEVEMMYANTEKPVSFKIENSMVVTRTIEGDFPPFERVIPSGFKTKIILEKDEFLRNIKLAAVFARDYSSVILFEIKKDGLYIRPRVKDEKGSEIYQEIEFEGEEQKIAFNFKFVLDFLNNIKSKRVVFEMTTPNSPGVFRADEVKNFLHIIMPIRTEEENS